MNIPQLSLYFPLFFAWNSSYSIPQLWDCGFRLMSNIGLQAKFWPHFLVQIIILPFHNSQSIPLSCSSSYPRMTVWPWLAHVWFQSGVTFILTLAIANLWARSYMFSVHVPGKMFSKQVPGTRAFRLRALWNVLGTPSFRFKICTHLGLRSMTCVYTAQRVKNNTRLMRSFQCALSVLIAVCVLSPAQLELVLGFTAFRLRFGGELRGRFVPRTWFNRVPAGTVLAGTRLFRTCSDYKKWCVPTSENMFQLEPYREHMWTPGSSAYSLLKVLSHIRKAITQWIKWQTIRNQPWKIKQTWPILVPDVFSSPFFCIYLLLFFVSNSDILLHCKKKKSYVWYET